jgi:hypothetical protein
VDLGGKACCVILPKLKFPLKSVRYLCTSNVRAICVAGIIVKLSIAITGAQLGGPCRNQKTVNHSHLPKAKLASTVYFVIGYLRTGPY